MTYMSTGEIFDRLLEGKGIISKADADALVYVHKIEKELKASKRYERGIPALYKYLEKQEFP